MELFMGLPVKTLSRDEWNCKLIKEDRRTFVSDGFFEGYVGLLRFDYVEKPITVSLNGISYDIIGKGIYWLQLAPLKEKWWMTGLYYPSGELKQFYFDITDGSFVDEKGEPSFYDLMLDVVALPDKSITVLDWDELDKALEDKFITPEQHAQSIADMKKLVGWLEVNFDKLVDFCTKYFNKLKSELN
jgi:predicted RNA-binding protein associated with RNAse of E/G family